VATTVVEFLTVSGLIPLSSAAFGVGVGFYISLAGSIH
jgi:hypothetical protein